MSDIFISYCNETHNRILQLVNALNNKGLVRFPGIEPITRVSMKYSIRRNRVGG